MRRTSLSVRVLVVAALVAGTAAAPASSAPATPAAPAAAAAPVAVPAVAAADPVEGLQPGCFVQRDQVTVQCSFLDYGVITLPVPWTGAGADFFLDGASGGVVPGPTPTGGRIYGTVVPKASQGELTIALGHSGFYGGDNPLPPAGTTYSGGKAMKPATGQGNGGAASVLLGKDGTGTRVLAVAGGGSGESDTGNGTGAPVSGGGTNGGNGISIFGSDGGGGGGGGKPGGTGGASLPSVLAAGGKNWSSLYVTDPRNEVAPFHGGGQAYVGYARIPTTISDVTFLGSPKAYQGGVMQARLTGPSLPAGARAPEGAFTFTWTSADGTSYSCGGPGSAVGHYNSAIPSGCLVAGLRTAGGDHTYTVTYSGDAIYAPSTSGPITVHIDPSSVDVDNSAVFDAARNAVVVTTTLKPFGSGIGRTPEGVVDGRVTYVASPASQDVTDTCTPQTTDPASDARIGQPVTFQCLILSPLPGTHSITAFYTPRIAADTIFAAGGSGQYTVPTYPTTAALTLDPTTSPATGPVRASVTVTPPSTARARLSGLIEVFRSDANGAPTPDRACQAKVDAAPGLPGTRDCSFPATATASGAPQLYVAVFTPDTDAFDVVTSPSADLSVTALPTVVTVTPDDSRPAYGQDVTLGIDVTANGAAVTTGGVDVVDGDPAAGGTTLGHVGLDAQGHASFVVRAPTPGTHRYRAVYTDAAGSYDHLPSTGEATPVLVAGVPATITLTTSDDPTAATAAGIPVTVTATMPLPSPHGATVATTAVSDSAGATPTCSAQTATTQAGTTTLTRVCTFLEQPGTQPTFTATYDDGVVTAAPTTASRTVSPSPTVTTLQKATSVFGVAPQLTATVRPVVVGTDLDGTVTFAAAGRPVCTTTVAVTAASGATTVTCQPTSGAAVPAGTTSLTATFTPDPTRTPLRASASGSPAATLAVDPAPVDVTVTVRSAGTGKVSVDVTTRIDGQVGGPIAVGRIHFGDGATCADTALDGRGTARCVLPAPTSTTTYSATFTRSCDTAGPGCNFTAGPTGRDSDDYDPLTGPCSGGFAAFVAAAGGGATHTVTVAGQGTVTVRATVDPAACRQGDQYPATVTLSLFAGTLTGSAVTASVDATGGLCLTDGILALEPAWHLGRLQPVAADPICFGFADDGGLRAAAVGSLTLAPGSAAHLPLVSVPGAGATTSSLAVQLASACPGVRPGATGTCATGSTVPVLRVTAAVDSGGRTAPGVRFAAVVSGDGSVRSDLATTTFDLFGGAASLAGTVDRVAKGAFTVAVTGGLSADASPAAGLTVLGTPGSLLRLDADGTVAVDGPARLGSGTGGVGVIVRGSLTGFGTYALTVASASTPAAWTPAAGLTFAPALAGTLRRTATATSFALTGAGAGATWAVAAGVDLRVDTVTVGSGAAALDPRCPTSGSAVTALTGTVVLHGLTVPGTACVDLTAGGWHVGVDDGTATLAAPGTAPMDLTGLRLDAARPAGGATTVRATATGGVSVRGTPVRDVPVTLSVTASALVVGGTVGGGAFGLPAGTAYLAFASDPVTGHDTGVPALGTAGLVDLAAGTTVVGAVTLSAAVTSTLLAAGLAVPSGAPLPFTAPLPADGTSPRFTTVLPKPGALPYLRLPAGAQVGEVSLSYTDGALQLRSRGTVPGEDGSSATVSLDLVVASNGAVSGSGTVDALSLLGTVSTLQGTLARSVDGTLSGALSATVPGDVVVRGVTLQSVTLRLGATGLTAAGTVATRGLAVPFTSTFASTSTYSLAVTPTRVDGWSPTPGVSVVATVSGALTRRADGSGGYDLTAVPVDGSTPLQSISAGRLVGFDVTALRLTDSPTRPTGCTVPAGQPWLGITATARLTASGTTTTAVSDGCFDLAQGTVALTAVVAGAPYTSGYPQVELGSIRIDLVDRAGVFTTTTSTHVTVTLPRLGTVGLDVPVLLGDTGIAVGGGVDLSRYLYGFSVSGHLFFATADGAYDTGSLGLGTLALQRGLMVRLAFALGDTVASGLRSLGVPVTGTSGVAALVKVASTGLDTPFVFPLDVGLHPVTLLDSGGFGLGFDSMALQVTVARSGVSFGVAANGTLRTGTLLPGSSASSVPVTGSLSLGTNGVSVSVGTRASWSNAFGIGGLVVDSLVAEGGINVDGTPRLAASATVSQLPQTVRDVLGYRSGAPMSLAVALDDKAPLLDLNVGDGTSTVFAPITLPSGVQPLAVTRAQIHIAPRPVTIGNVTYAAGYSAALAGSVFGLNVQAAAKFDPAAKTFSASASSDAFTFGPLHMRQVTFDLDASRSGASVRFRGGVDLGPVSVNLELLRGTFSAGAGVDVTIGTSGIAALADLHVAGSVDARVPLKFCKKWGIPYPCGVGDWAHLGDFGFDVRLGFALNSSGLSITVPWLGSVGVPFGSGSFPTLDARATALTPTGGLSAAADLSRGFDQLPTLPAAAGSSARPAVLAAAAGSPARWDRTGSLGAPRLLPAGVVLPDGRVLVAGGVQDATSVLGSSELYDPTTGGWSSTGALRTPRADTDAVLLADGGVLVAGGLTTGGGVTASAERYDPESGTWSGAGELSQARQSAALVTLPDGGVLAIGGSAGASPSATVDAYDPTTHRWSPTTPLPEPRLGATATVLEDGDVLVAGGFGTGGALGTAVRYHPTTRTWLPTAPMIFPASFASATLLPGGDVLVAGGTGVPQRFHVGTGTWAAAGSPELATMPGARAAMATMPDGEVVVAGGVLADANTANVAVFDPATDTWTPQPALPDAIGGARAFALPSGILLAGGAPLGASAGTADDTARSGAYVFHLATANGEAPAPVTPARAFGAGAPAATASSGGVPWAIVIGSVVAVLLLGALALVWRRRRRPQEAIEV